MSFGLLRISRSLGLSRTSAEPGFWAGVAFAGFADVESDGAGGEARAAAVFAVGGLTATFAAGGRARMGILRSPKSNGLESESQPSQRFNRFSICKPLSVTSWKKSSR